MENAQPLKATVRENLGKGPSRRLRVSGKLPGVVYGRDFTTVSVMVEPKELLARLKGDYGLNSIFRLEIEGHETQPIVRVNDFQRDPVRRNLKHVDFEVMRPSKVITTKVPLNLNGIAKGVKNGGTLRQIRPLIKIIAKPADIPMALDIDVSELAIGEMLRVSEITAPSGVTIPFDDNFSVATVFVPRGIEEVEEEGEEEDAAVVEE